MSDQCKGCIFQGDIESCQSSECYQHDNWYAKTQADRIQRLEAELSAFKGAMDYADRNTSPEMSTANDYRNCMLDILPSPPSS